jgi:hypothetical protein
MSNERIGQWVARVGEAPIHRYLTLWHYVESVVSEEPITNCGRRLRQFDETSFRYMTEPDGAWLCNQCMGVRVSPPAVDSPGAEIPEDVAPGDEPPGP